jgi:hypothetical protein
MPQKAGVTQEGLYIFDPQGTGPGGQEDPTPVLTPSVGERGVTLIVSKKILLEISGSKPAA